MSERTKKIKRLLKICIIICILSVFVVFGFFIKHTHNFENYKMSKWLGLSQQQQIYTLNKIIPESETSDLMIACMTKIAGLPDSDEMIIRDAAALCYNGIKLSAQDDNKQEKK